jgi:hypothetical protein
MMQRSLSIFRDILQKFKSFLPHPSLEDGSDFIARQIHEMLDISGLFLVEFQY